MNNTVLKSTRPLLLVFAFITAFCITGKAWLAKQGVNQEVLIMGNMILLLVSLFAFVITHRAIESGKPQAFVRAMYGSFIIKFFVVAIVAFVYIMVARKNVNKPALIACAGLYIIYTGIETRALINLLKQKKNA
jgi:heme/copper-type cytochrome/quinol oxidase subunit 3